MAENIGFSRILTIPIYPNTNLTRLILDLFVSGHTVTRNEGVALGGCYANTGAMVIRNLMNIHGMYPLPVPEEAPKQITCLGLWGQATVRPNGDISVCCYTYKPLLGNLHENSFMEIWHSRKAEKLKALAKSGKYIDKPCIGCDSGHPVFTEDLLRNNSLENFWQMCMNAR